MGKFVTNTALLTCNQGMAPSQLSVVGPRPKCGGQAMANTMDFAPMLNIKPFGMCRSLANPQVASATAPAAGVLTPMPCIPNIVAPWSPGGKEKVAMFPALLDNSKCNCLWGGQISVSFVGNVAPAKGE